jgi:hypothetical protein
VAYLTELSDVHSGQICGLGVGHALVMFWTNRLGGRMRDPKSGRMAFGVALHDSRRGTA